MKRLVYLFLLTVILFSFSCKSGSKEYVLATYTYHTNNRLANLQPLANWLQKETGLRFRTVSYASVEDLITAIRNDSVDLAMINTTGYLLLQKETPGAALPLVNLKMNNDSSTNYGGCIITREDSRFKSKEDLQKLNNKLPLALVNSSSTSGNLLPRLLLSRWGYSTADSVFRVYYAGSHRAVVDDVLKGKAELGGCGCDEIQKPDLAGSLKNIRVLDSYNNIPLGPIIHTGKIEKDQLEKIKEELLELHTSNAAVFRQLLSGWTEFMKATQFQEVSDEHYEEFRGMMGNLKM